jgi:hypothetical protein
VLVKQKPRVSEGGVAVVTAVGTGFEGEFFRAGREGDLDPFASFE